jgi:hypothetical protein
MSDEVIGLMPFDAAGLEHFQHSVGDDEAAHDVAGGGNDGHRAEKGGQRGFMFARQNDRADHRNRVQGVGQGHQRSVQQRRNAANHFESDECRKHEHVQTG